MNQNHNTPCTHVAIQGVCAWPNLVPLDDETILAIIFNQPCHGAWEGDVDCWSSTDQGITWRFRGRVAPHEAGTNRMNVAAGKTASGSVIVLASGWSNKGRPYEAPPRPPSESRVLPAWICRSSDAGRTWEILGNVPDIEGVPAIPFGKIECATDGSLRATAYLGYAQSASKPIAAWLLKGTPDGSRWEPLAPIAQGINETDILRVGKTEWLAVGRGDPIQQLHLYRSLDDGQTWCREGSVSLPRQIPAHLLQTPDGRLVLTYGNRCLGHLGVDGRISRDNGRTWGAPFRIAAAEESWDCGYPSTVLLKNGRLLTAFYQQISGEYHYEMKTTIWDLAWVDRWSY